MHVWENRIRAWVCMCVCVRVCVCVCLFPNVCVRVCVFEWEIAWEGEEQRCAMKGGEIKLPFQKESRNMYTHAHARVCVDVCGWVSARVCAIEIEEDGKRGSEREKVSEGERERRQLFKFVLFDFQICFSCLSSSQICPSSDYTELKNQISKPASNLAKKFRHSKTSKTFLTLRPVRLIIWLFLWFFI